MRIFFSESNNDYTTYTFNYAVYAIAEQLEELENIYHQGFLPYSSNITLQHEIFYLARSLRVNLEQFEDSSENRRVDRKIESLNIHFELIPKNGIDINNSAFLNFCLSYAQERFSNNAMNEARLNYVLNRDTGTHWLVFKSEEKILAYVLLAIHGKAVHYWYAFLDATYLEEYPLGKWIMWRSIKWAKENNYSKVYLGTCYGNSALYKTRDFKGLSFFDGYDWNGNINTLKGLCKMDEQIKTSDQFKLEENQNEIIKTLLQK